MEGWFFKSDNETLLQLHCSEDVFLPFFPMLSLSFPELKVQQWEDGDNAGTAATSAKHLATYVPVSGLSPIQVGFSLHFRCS